MRNMSRKIIQLGKHIKEIRIHVCQTSEESKGVREFIDKYYILLKEQNCGFPILVRECSGISPKMYTRYVKILSSSALMALTHVIFDLDGVLLDTECLYTKATEMIVSEFGKTYTYECKMNIMGRSTMEGASRICKLLDLPINSYEFIERMNKITKNMFPEAKFMPGAERLVHHFNSYCIPIAIATSSSSYSLELKMSKKTYFFSLFSHVVSGSSDPEISRSKPSPDIFIVCASRFSDPPPPEKCLVIEDSPAGLEAGKKAGMSVLMVPDHYLDKKSLISADKIISSLEEFSPVIEGSSFNLF